jgi:hypothetical protein
LPANGDLHLRAAGGRGPVHGSVWRCSAARATWRESADRERCEQRFHGYGSFGAEGG